MNTLITLKNITYTYPGKTEPAVDDVSLSVKRGEFVAVLGHNGSGKSTLAKMLNALILPSSGDIIVNSFNTKDSQHLFDIRKSVGMVFQNPDNQLVATIVEDDVAFGPENLGIEPNEIRQRVDDALSSVGMIDFKDKQPHHLSGGQKQRVAIAGVLAMAPDCIIFDESTAMLDPQGRREVLEQINKLHQAGVTIVLITHYMDEAALADRVIVMSRGKIIKDDIPHNVFSDVESLKQHALDVPAAYSITNKLRQHGIHLKGITNNQTLVEALCQLK